MTPDLIVSLHEGPQEGFMIVATAAGSRTVAEAMVDAVRQAHLPLARRSFLGLPLGVQGLSFEGQAVTLLKRLARLNTLGSYGTARGIGTYTTESGWGSPDVESRISSHVVAVDAVLRRGLGR